MSWLKKSCKFRAGSIAFSLRPSSSKLKRHSKFSQRGDGLLEDSCPACCAVDSGTQRYKLVNLVGLYKSYSTEYISNDIAEVVITPTLVEGRIRF